MKRQRSFTSKLSSRYWDNHPYVGPRRKRLLEQKTRLCMLQSVYPTIIPPEIWQYHILPHLLADKEEHDTFRSLRLVSKQFSTLIPMMLAYTHDMMHAKYDFALVPYEFRASNHLPLYEAAILNNKNGSVLAYIPSKMRSLDLCIKAAYHHGPRCFSYVPNDILFANSGPSTSVIIAAMVSHVNYEYFHDTIHYMKKTEPRFTMPFLVTYTVLDGLRICDLFDDYDMNNLMLELVSADQFNVKCPEQAALSIIYTEQEKKKMILDVIIQDHISTMLKLNPGIIWFFDDSYVTSENAWLAIENVSTKDHAVNLYQYFITLDPSLLMCLFEPKRVSDYVHEMIAKEHDIVGILVVFFLHFESLLSPEHKIDVDYKNRLILTGLQAIERIVSNTSV